MLGRRHRGGEHMSRGSQGTIPQYNPSQMGATTTLMDDVLQLDHDGPKDLGEDHIVHLTSGR